MRAIIAAAGPNFKWKNPWGSPVHWMAVHASGEPLLARTIRQLYERGVRDIWVCVKDEETAEAYRQVVDRHWYSTIQPAPQVGLQLDAGDRPEVGTMFDQYVPLWHPDDRTLIVLGDVYFTDEAMDTIVGFEPKEWQLFCRFGPSSLTRSPYGEPFVQSFWPEHQYEHKAAFARVHRLWLDESNPVWRTGVWEHYRVMGGSPDSQVNSHIDWGRRTEIDDWTDDFDFYEDYQHFYNNYLGFSLPDSAMGDLAKSDTLES